MYAMPGAAQKTNGNAIASLVLSIIGLFFCPIVFSVLAIYLAGKANQEIRVSWGRQGGESLAKAGQIIGWIGIVLSVVFLLFWLGRS